MMVKVLHMAERTFSICPLLTCRALRSDHPEGHVRTLWRSVQNPVTHALVSRPLARAFTLPCFNLADAFRVSGPRWDHSFFPWLKMQHCVYWKGLQGHGLFHVHLYIFGTNWSANMASTEYSQASINTSTLPAASTPIPFLFLPFTVSETWSYLISSLHMHNTVHLSCLFKDITVRASSHYYF